MSSLYLVVVGLVAAAPCIYLLAAVVSGPRRGWRVTLGCAWAVFATALSASALFAVAHPAQPVVARLPGMQFAGLAPSLRVDTLTLAMLALIGFIGVVILSYSRRYMEADPGRDDPRQSSYRTWFCATLAAVSTLVVSNQLWLLGLAWIATSLCLHQLLTYYTQRPKALLAAHKKFLSSRLADAFILTAIALIGSHFDTFQIDVILAAVATTDWSAALSVGCALLACAAILKCAQLPFHGWLIQVMEAPTPVSALLHAGIVNIGGFLMIRFAPLMAPATLAQTLLVIAGTTTAVTAGLIMSTRVSIKVMLAWSTCAQMGFMLLECGLGLYGLALLHLLAHSLYKAHSFLTAGEMTAVSARRARTPNWSGTAGRVAAALVAALAALAITLQPTVYAAHVALIIVVIGALGTLAGDTAGFGLGLWRRTLFGGLLVAGLYALWSFLFSHLEPTRPPADMVGAQIGITVAFAALFAVRAALGTRAGARRLRWLHPHIYGGLYLDQMFTRVTLLVWPPRLPERGHDPLVHPPHADPSEAEA